MRSTDSHLSLLRTKKEAGALSSGAERVLCTLEDKLSHDRECLAVASSFEPTLGKVYCTFGVGSSAAGTSGLSSWILDWALVEVLTSRCQVFSASSGERVPVFARFLLYQTLESHPTPRGLDLDMFEEITGMATEQFSSHGSCGGGMAQSDLPNQKLEPQTKTMAANRPEQHHVVFKRGRTTGKTQGELNNVASSVRMRYSGPGGDTVTVEGRTLLVVCPAATSAFWAAGNRPDAAWFGSHGDSGSLCFDSTGKALGIYIGGQAPDRAKSVDQQIEVHSVDGLHFISPISPTLESIQATVTRDPMFTGYDDVDVDLLWGEVGAGC